MERVRSLIALLAMLQLMLVAASTVRAQGPGIYVIEITGDVDRGMAHYVRRALDEATASHAKAVVLHINTFGGRVDVATEIRDAVLNAPMPVIAYVDKRAISAGALIALSAGKIAMAPGGSIGAATPVNGAGERAPEKVVSYMRGEMRATAEKNHRDPRIAEAMVDEAVTLPDSALKRDGSLLTMTADEAKSAGYCDVVAPTMTEALRELGYEEPRIQQTVAGWSEGLVTILTTPVASAILIMLGLGGIIYTIKTAHLSPIGGIGVVAIGLFFGAQYMADLASYIEVLMFIVGIVLLVLEIFVIPGFGAAGIIGTILVVASLFLSLVSGFSYDAILVPLYTLAAAFVGLTILVALMVRYLPASNTFNRFALNAALPAGGGDMLSASYQGLMGSEGAALTTLRPAGLALFGGERYDVITEGEFIVAGEQVRVVRVEGRKIIVRRA
jgi:membrane-bound serine protease (ClpP class)